jgi:hypothetical protein
VKLYKVLILFVVQSLRKATKSNSKNTLAVESVFSASSFEERVSALQNALNYPVIERDREGLKFWYLRPREEDTQPIAVGFYEELNRLNDREAKAFITSEKQQQEIYGH